ncbi:MAG: hypothetical protein IDH49_14840 [Gammaproteobacteria bacterium]|nr:hypothetical protein [Gammaproteobacteria bacterium]
MKKRRKFVSRTWGIGLCKQWMWCAITAFFLMPQAHAEEKFSFGAGVGAMYSGLGINVGLKTERQLKYVAAGCLGHSRSRSGDGVDSVDERDWACGVGAGMLRTDLFGAGNNKHGLGLYVGAVGSANESDPKVIQRPGSMTVVYGVKPIYGIGISYVYFWNGIFDKGLNLGITPAVGFDNGAWGSLLLQAGYQFK